MIRVSAVVLAYLDEPWLEKCVEALLSSEGVETEVIVVDNGCTNGAVDRVSDRDGVNVVVAGSNLGFAGGCNLGAAQATGEVIALINSDAVVDAGAVRRLAEVAVRRDVGIACGSVRLAEDPEKLNSAGNPIHFLGLSWAGSFREPAAAHSLEQEVAGASGAAMSMRRELWERLGGFEERYFAYHEDAEISLRCWQQGLSVVYVPDAAVVHHYEFARTQQKFYLLERNRLIFVLTLFETSTLAAIMPALLLFEAGTLVVSIAQGWWRQKISAWRWVIANRRWIRGRRGILQRERTVPDRRLVHLFDSRFTAGNYPLPGYLEPFDWLLACYWSAVRRVI